MKEGRSRPSRYHQYCDDYYLNMNLNTEMELPNNRDTVLHFFEQMKKGFPELRNFYTRENGDLVLEGDKEQDSYRWLAIEPRRLCSGQMNPETLDDAFRQHEMVLDLAPPLLTSHLVMACIAFLIRLTNTCWICVASIGVAGSCRASLVLTLKPRLSISG